MTSSEPGPHGTTTELTGELLRQAYPDRAETWFNEKAENAVRSIKSAAPRQFQASKNAISSRRRRPDARRKIVRWGIAAVLVRSRRR